MDEKLRPDLDNAVKLWREFWGDNLVSLHIYGSMARGDASRRSDINLVMFLKQHEYDRWNAAAAISRRGIKRGFAVPLLLTLTYLEHSLDVYPIEFLDMKLFHQTLYGPDPFEKLEISPDDLRLQAEREIKGKWVALRQAALELSGNTTAMRDLLAMTVPTWNAVFQALLVIEGRDVPADKRELLRQGCALAELETSVFEQLVQVRHDGKALNRNAAGNLLKQTLLQVDRLAAFADSLTVNM